MGSIYRRKRKDKEGNVIVSKTWWLKYYRNGKPYYESSGCIEKEEAKRLLKMREGDISKGKIPGVYFDRIMLNTLFEGLRREYRLNQRKSFSRLEISLKHLEDYFKGFKVVQVITPKIEMYVEHRKNEGAANATINRELAALKRMLKLGARQYPPKVDRVPYIPMLKENNTRKGFFEHHEYVELLKALPSFLRPVVIFGYKTGWRKSEILGLKWGQVDLNERTARLEAGETKNSEARTIYLDDELLKLFKIQRLRTHKDCGFIFHNGGNQIKDFRGSWAAACEKAKIEGKFFHDLRRTAVRNMVRSGIPENVAMKISGHKTRAVFDRYNITNFEDLKLAAEKQEAYLKGKEKWLTPNN